MFPTLDTPQLLIDLDVVDANLERMFSAYRNARQRASSFPE